jgi:uncharacterized protein (TIGR02231 family)
MKGISFVLLLCVAQLATAQSIRTVDSKVVKVTVFPQSAQVLRTAHTTVPAGRSEITFSGLSAFIDQSSIQVEGEGGFTIISVSPQPNKLREQKKRKEIEDIERSKEAFQKQMIQQQAMVEVYTKEEKMLEANYRVGGENTGLKAADLAAALDLHRSRLRELKYYEIDYNEKIKKIQDTLNQIDEQIRVLNANADVSTTDLVVSLSTSTGVTGDFNISYVVGNAGWYPSYDLHVDDISKPLVLNYKANVHQNTGEEWKDVRLIFSSGNPNESGVAPILNPLYLRNLIPQYYNTSAPGVSSVGDAGKSISINGAREDETQYIVNGHRAMAKAYLKEDKKTNIVYSDPSQNATAITFELATAYTVINDGKNRAVDMKQEEIPATFKYFAVPKRSKKAFLMAHISNWLDYNLMDGEVNLYFEGTYTGKTAFSLANASDTLNLSLGHDKSIAINRTLVKEFSRKQMLTDKKSAASTYEISVRNNKKFPIHIVVEDQLPLSNDKEITIEDTQYEGASLDEATGQVTWKLDIAPGKEQKQKLSYTVKYPKSYKVQIN